MLSIVTSCLCSSMQDNPALYHLARRSYIVLQVHCSLVRLCSIIKLGLQELDASHGAFTVAMLIYEIKSAWANACRLEAALVDRGCAADCQDQLSHTISVHVR